MTGDARVDAWVGAWDSLESARKALGGKFPSVGTAVEGLHKRAEVLARLASAPADVGEAACAVLRARAEERERSREAFNLLLARRGESE